MSTAYRLLLLGALIALVPSLGSAQQTDFSEMSQWLQMSAQQGSIPVGTKITMSNWQQYKAFMPLGMIKLFEGTYGWKMPADFSTRSSPAPWPPPSVTWTPKLASTNWSPTLSPIRY